MAHDDFAADWDATRIELARCEARLQTVPAPADRDPGQVATAAEAHRAARHARAAFLRKHARRVYDDLTAGLTTRPRASELALTAGDRFPGLVPSRRQLAEEAERHQAGKEGREIDQGLFFHALLADRVAGEHLIESMRHPTAAALALLDRLRETGQVRLTAAQLECREGVAHLTITNAHCLNAEDNQHVEDLETLVDLALLNPDVQVGVLRGGVVDSPRYAGRRVFSAGINLKELRRGRISFVDFLLTRELGYIAKMLRGLGGEDGPVLRQKPWIGVVDTFAIGGGAQILLACDHVVAEDDAYLSLPAAEEGIVPGLANLRLTRHLGARPARRVILGGRRIHVRDPEAALLIDDVVDPGALDDAVKAAAGRLAGPAVVANRHMLIAAEEPVEAFRTYLAEFSLQQAHRLYGGDVLARLDAAWRG
ncbi:(3,5-dihydroxyphenyl)acetyl-CoA 1,2-dioxygenase DpgC [Streptomyces fuscichromogenes]|nr:(3,5-dihydroxyphenyl)acetyl-CoA 1,2-dioxygenase DpgC [Streptomyces fuscichromogenes]